MVEDMKSFIKIYQKCMIVHFKLEEFIEKKPELAQFFTPENIYCFAAGSLFVPQIFLPLHQVLKKIDKDQEDALIKNYKKYTKAKPEDFDVDPKYCLNNVTVKYFVEKNLDVYSDDHIENMDFDDLEICNIFIIFIKI